MVTWQPDLAPLVKRIAQIQAILKSAAVAQTIDLGVTPGMRALMASLADGPPRAVPDLARERSVSRQHLQTVVNDLLAAALAQALPNPAHRRSPLIALTEDGVRRLRQVRERETQMLARAAPAVAYADIAAAMRLFDALERNLSGAAR